MASVPEEINPDINSSFDVFEIRINYLESRKKYAEYALRTLCIILNYSLPGVHDIDREDVAQRIDSCKEWILELDASIEAIRKDQNIKPTESSFDSAIEFENFNKNMNC